MKEMFEYLSKFFEKKRIDCWGTIPLDACTVRKPYLLERAGITHGTVILVAVPYYTEACADPARNISAYAVSRDYHAFFEAFYAEALAELRARFPENRFAGFSDHSPIDEVEAAARIGLGVIGKNHLLLTEKYSSYIFLGELVTDAILPCKVGEIEVCEGCGLCMKQCPASDCGGCLSALTQKKGALSDDEQAAILRYGSAWGCDICQEVCPHTKRAIACGSIFTPIPFFREQTLACLTSEALDGMSDEVFAKRAYAWRGRETVRRNLLLLEAASCPK